MKTLQFIEPIWVPDTVITGIAYFEDVAPEMYRIAYYNRQRCCLDGSNENVIVAKVVLHREHLIRAMRQAMFQRHLSVGELVEGH